LSFCFLSVFFLSSFFFFFFLLFTSAAAVLQHTATLPGCEQQHWGPAAIKQQPVTLLLHLLLVHVAPH
jgi:hypothetical protein